MSTYRCFDCGTILRDDDTCPYCNRVTDKDVTDAVYGKGK